MRLVTGLGVGLVLAERNRPRRIAGAASGAATRLGVFPTPPHEIVPTPTRNESGLENRQIFATRLVAQIASCSPVRIL